MIIESDVISYEVTRHYAVSGIDPVPQWDSPVAPGPMLTPCTVRIVWNWTITTGVHTTVSVWGYRTRKDGSRSKQEPSEIFSLGRTRLETMPEWLRGLAEDRPTVVTTFGA